MSKPDTDPREHPGAAMTCRECVAFLVDYLEQLLPADQLRTFEAHLDYCPDCRVYLDNYRATLAATQDLAQAETTEKAPPRLVEAILAARKHSHE